MRWTWVIRGASTVLVLPLLVLGLEGAPTDAVAMLQLERCRRRVEDAVRRAAPVTAALCGGHELSWVAIAEEHERYLIEVRWLDWRHARVERRVRMVDRPTGTSGRGTH